MSNIISNDSGTLGVIKKLATDEGVEVVVIGHSLDQGGQENVLMEKVHTFVAQLESELQLPVHLQNEVFSSGAARNLYNHDKPVASPRKKSQPKHIDDSAAAIILQRYLDTK